MKNEIELPPLIVTKWFTGYDRDKLYEVLGEKFGTWMNGQTMAQHTMPDGTKVAVVYSWDVENYLRGGRPLD